MISRQLIDEYLANPETMKKCNKMYDGQEFEISNPYEMPEGICASAWADIRSYILTIASGGSFKFMKDKNTILANCADLFRPVLFKIEKI